jgi:fatty acid desaturase
MSRAERRAYKRMMKNQDPYALPGGGAQRARAERQRARRPKRASAGEAPFLTSRFLVWALGGGVIVGLLAFSLAWPSGMPFALYMGLVGALVWMLLAAGVRLLQRRMPPVPR